MARPPKESAMPRDERVLVVFAASPSDLEPERSRLEEVIRETNATWSRTVGVRLDLVRWETHGYPGVGQRVQEVLNRELPGDYDIFVGIMWAKYGTPTGRAGSGTEEEFNRALERFRAKPSSVKIMFYFKDAPLPPSAIDSKQLEAIQRFRASLGTEGVLYWAFGSLEEFERLIRLHLARQIQEFIGGQAPQQAVAAAELEPPSSHGGQEDLGLLDLLDIVEECSSDLKEITERISAETEALGRRLGERTEEITLATTRDHPQLSRREAKTLIEKAALDMNQYVARMKTEMPIFREAWAKSADAVARAALMMVDFDSEDQKQVREARGALVAIVDVLGTTYESIETFRTTVNRLPRLTTVLNRAKRETVGILEELLASMAAGRRVVSEALRTLDALLGNGGAGV